MRQERTIGFFHQLKVHPVFILHEETLFGLQEHGVEHVFALSGQVEIHGGIILDRGRLAALSVHLLEVAARKQEDVFSFLVHA